MMAKYFLRKCVLAHTSNVVFSPTMKKIFASTFILFVLFQLEVRAQSLPIGQWRSELCYRNANSVTASDNKVYCTTTISMYSVDINDHSMEPFTKVNGLSDINTSLVAYDKAHDLLMVCYSNSNIDILQNGLVTNISDIKRKSIVGDKSIYSIYFLGDYAYLGCGFGIVVFDMMKFEIKEIRYE